MDSENSIENYLRAEVKKHGGECLKFVSPGRNGVPDRVVLLPMGQIFFVETKAPGKTPRKSQLAVHRDFERIGVKVRVIDSRSAVRDFLREVSAGGV